MNSKSISKTKLFFAIATALVLLLLCVIPSLFVGVAYADGNGGSNEGNSGSSNGDNAGDSSSPCDLYYFTDYEYSQDFCNELYGTVGSIDYNYWEPDVFQETFRNNYENGIYQNIRDAHIIFEMREKLHPQVLTDDCFMYVLRDFFQEMKDNGCFIMFIFGTDESRIKGLNEFLGNVDIHVNTDLLYTFVSNIFDDVAEDCGGELLENCTFLINKYFAFDYKDVFGSITKNQKWDESEFFREYFLVYFKSVYRSMIESMQIPLIKVFNKYNIKVLYEISGHIYIDVSKLQDGVDEYAEEDAYVDIGDHVQFYPDYMEGQHVYAIGKAMYDAQYFDSVEYVSLYKSDYERWLQELRNLQTHSFEFPIYVYNAEANYFINRNNIFKSGKVDKSEINVIAVDFLNDEDLTVYDNWSGRCDVTHKMIKFGPNGWMADLENSGGGSSSSGGSGLLDEAKRGWQMYMSQLDYDYFFDNYNIY